MRTAIFIVAVMGLASIAGAQDAVALQAELAQVKAERDALRVQLAQAQLRIKQLEGQLQAGSAAPLTSEAAAGGGTDMTVTVKVISVTSRPVDDQRAELSRQQKELESLDRELGFAKSRYQSMERQNRVGSSPTSSVTLGSARADITRLEGRIRSTRVQITRLQEEIADAAQTRAINGHDVLSGELVKAIATGPVSELAATLKPESVYTITGRKRVVNGATELLVRSIKAE